MCQMCNVIHHSGFGCVVQEVVDLYKKSKYSQNEIVIITRALRKEGKSDKEIIKFLGLKQKSDFKMDRKYLKKLYGFVKDSFRDPQFIQIKDIDDLNPSGVVEEYWLYAENKGKKFYEDYTKNCGKWMIFANKGEELDLIWKQVKELTEKGLLVDSCKVSTTKENPNALTRDMGVICIYTYNSNDKEDLLRVANQLFKIDRVSKLVYKEDKATGEGKYAIKGDKKISKYFVTRENYKAKLSEDLNRFLNKK